PGAPPPSPVGRYRERVQPEAVAAPLAKRDRLALDLERRQVGQRGRLELPGRVVPSPRREPRKRRPGIGVGELARDPRTQTAAGRPLHAVPQQPPPLLESAAPVQLNG